MSIYIITVLNIIISYPIINHLFGIKGRKYYCIYVTLCLLLLTGLRNDRIGNFDTYNVYLPLFRKVLTVDLFDIWRNSHFANNEVFYFFTKLFTFISVNEQVWIFVLAVPFLLMTGVIVYKYSEQPIISFLLFLALRYYTSSFYLLYHCVAMAVLMFSYKYILDRKLVKFIITVLCASLFHKTALVFLIAYPITKLKFGIKQYILIGGVTIASLIFTSYMLRFIQIFQLQDAYTRYFLDERHRMNLTGYLILLALLIFFTYYYRVYKEKNSLQEQQINILYNMVALSLVFMIISTVIGEFHRISMFFGIYNIILLPNVINSISLSKQRQLYYQVIGIGLSIFFLLFVVNGSNWVPYRFFWQY